MLVDDIIDHGILMSYASRPDSLALSTPELVGVVNREMHALVEAGIGANPWYFAQTSDVVYNSTQAGWIIPEHEVLLRVELASTGEAVSVLPMDQRLVPDDDLPRVFHVRGVLKTTGLSIVTATVATTELLRMFYVPVLTSLTATTDAPSTYAIPERFQDTLSYKVAVYLAAKDGRDDDQQRFEQEAQRQGARYVNWVGRHLATVNSYFLPGQRVAERGMGPA